jgi:hypothetical protein
MTTLLENPWPVIVLGILVEAVLGVVLLRTGRGVWLWPMVGVLLLAVAGVGLEWLVVTDAEEVEATLLAESAGESQALLRWAINRVDFTDVKITHLEVDVNYYGSPPRAEARLNAFVRFRDRTGQIPYENRPVAFTIELCRQSDRWLITGHQWHDDPRGR